MKIAFFEAKDYDRVWFGESAKEYGFTVHFIEDKFCVTSMQKIDNEEVICMPIRHDFSVEEVISMRRKNIQAIMMLVDNDIDSLKTGVLSGIPVITATRFSPR